MKLALFCIFYLREWPLYLIGLLRTAELNPAVHFYFITNLNFSHPSWFESNGGKLPAQNIHLISLELKDLITKINDNYGPNYSLPLTIRPYKVNDFKPLLGNIFRFLLSNYTHWGYFDPDIIIGNLDSIYSKYSHDVISYGGIVTQGPLMIIKNTQQLANLHEYFSTKTMSAIFDQSPSLVDERHFGAFVKTHPEISHIVLTADCENQLSWLYYQGNLWGKTGECALVHFGGGTSHRSGVRKLHESNFLRPFYLNISSSSSSDISYGYGYSEIRGQGSAYYYFQIFSNNTEEIHPMNISFTVQEWNIVLRMLSQANIIWKKMNQRTVT